MIDDKLKALFLSLLEDSLNRERKFDRISITAHSVGVDLTGVMDQFWDNTQNAIADYLGVPKENTWNLTDEEIDADTAPVGYYSRDWIGNSWSDVVEGDMSVERFIDELIEEAQEHATLEGA